MSAHLALCCVAELRPVKLTDPPVHTQGHTNNNNNLTMNAHANEANDERPYDAKYKAKEHPSLKITYDLWRGLQGLGATHR